jgi:hypothetical protein
VELLTCVAVSGLNLWLAAGALACSSLVCSPQLYASDSAAAAPTPVAHSALVTLEAGPSPAGLLLRLRHTADQTPLSVTDLRVSVAGKSQLALRRADGSWFVPLSNAASADDQLEVVVAHDGIREVLSGRITVPGAGSNDAHSAGAAVSVLRDHKQMAWWILNITIVLIAAIAISRRLS